MLALIPLFPFLGFVVNATMGRRLPKSVSGGLASLVMLASFAVSVISVLQLAGLPPDARTIDQTLYTWIASGDLNIALAFRVDPLSAVMILVITGIGSLIHIYSTAYMHEESDPEYARYFSYLNLFAFFMLVLVLGVTHEQMQRAGPHGRLQRPVGAGRMEDPLQRAASRVGQVHLARPLQRHVRRNPGDGRLDRIELQLGVGPAAKGHLPPDRRIGVGQLEFGLPLAQQVPGVIHEANVRYRNRRMLLHCTSHPGIAGSG